MFQKRVGYQEKIYTGPGREALPRPIGEVQAVQMQGSEGVGEIVEVADVGKGPGSNQTRGGSHTKNIYVIFSVRSGKGKVPVTATYNVSIRIKLETASNVCKKCQIYCIWSVNTYKDKRVIMYGEVYTQDVLGSIREFI